MNRKYFAVWTIICLVLALFVLSGQTCVFCDRDGDGFPSIACGGDDCDDADPAVNTGADEICDDNIDNNCNGQTDEGCEQIACVGVNPESGEAGDMDLDLTITFEVTGIDLDGVTLDNEDVTFGCAGITVQSTSLNSVDNEIYVTVDIDAEAPNCTGDVEVNEEGQTLLCEDGFMVINSNTVTP